jgi:hypothetical protein
MELDKTNIEKKPVVPPPIMKQYDFRNFRHYSCRWRPGVDPDFSLDVNVSLDTYIELYRFKSELYTVKDATPFLVEKFFWMGHYQLNIRNAIGATYNSLGKLMMPLVKAKIENEHLIWDYTKNQKLNFYIDNTFVDWGGDSIVLPTDLNMVLSFTFCEYPKSLYEFMQQPNIYL